jgi:hypothetical protein
VADSSAQFGPPAASSQRLRDELAAVAATYGDSAQSAYVAALYGIETWDTTPARGLALDTAAGADSAADKAAALPFEFALRPDALLLFYPVGMVRHDFEFMPDEEYVFPFRSLQPRNILLPVAGSVGR